MHKWTGVAAIVLMALGTGGQAVAAQPSDRQVRELFGAMHLDAMFDQMNAQMAGLMEQGVPCVPATYWKNFINAGNREQLLSQMVPIYQRHFSADDVAGLLKFYRSPLGRKVVTQMPMTMAEGMRAGQAWGRARGLAMIAQLQKSGTLDGNGRCPASPAAMPAMPAAGQGH